MQLTDAQKTTVAAWLEQGLKLAEIQSRIGTEFGHKLTYMEVRFLIDDLKLKVKDPVVEAPPEPPKPDPAAASSAAPADGAVPPEDAAPGLGGVKVSVDTLARPGTLVSGGVTFSDGQKATWYLDQTGRLGLASDTKGYRPPQEDLMEFQALLQDELAKLGY